MYRDKAVIDRSTGEVLVPLATGNDILIDSYGRIGMQYVIVGRSLLKESLLTGYQCMPSARTMECARRIVLYRTCVFRP